VAVLLPLSTAFFTFYVLRLDGLGKETRMQKVALINIYDDFARLIQTDIFLQKELRAVLQRQRRRQKLVSLYLVSSFDAI
jgi:hypothetical protein